MPLSLHLPFPLSPYRSLNPARESGENLEVPQWGQGRSTEVCHLEAAILMLFAGNQLTKFSAV